MATKYAGGGSGLAWEEGDAVTDRADPTMEFPGCDPVPMTWDDVVAYDGRIEYWDAASSTAQVLRAAGPVHESPPNVLSEILTRISLELGSRIRCYGAVYLMERDRAGQPRRVMVGDQTIYLRPGAQAAERPGHHQGRGPAAGRDPGGGSHHRRPPQQARAVRVLGVSGSMGGDAGHLDVESA